MNKKTKNFQSQLPNTNPYGIENLNCAYKQLSVAAEGQNICCAADP